MSLAKLEKKFRGWEVPEELIELYGFEQYCKVDSGVDYTESLFCQSFYIELDDLYYYEDSLKSWSEDDRFVKSFLIFAHATEGGSEYAFWDDGSGKKLIDMPIVVIGDEGDIALVAVDLRNLMRLLTLDSEVSLYNNYGSYFLPDEDASPSEYKQEYRIWLKKNFDLQPIENEDQAQDIVDEAVETYGDTFTKWVNPFLDYEYEIDSE